MARAAPVSAVLLMSLAGLLGTEQVSAQVTLAVRGGASNATLGGDGVTSADYGDNPVTAQDRYHRILSA